MDISKTLVVDVETDGLVNPTTIHVIVCQDLVSGDQHTFIKPMERLGVKAKFFSLLQQYRQGYVSGHDFLGYDLGVLDSLLPGHGIAPSRVIDTLVLSRLFNYQLQGGHSMERWGAALGTVKVGAGIEDWSKLTDEMIERCKSDVTINRKLLLKMRPYIEDEKWDSAIRLEHDTAIILNEMTQSGVCFNVEKAKVLHRELIEKLRPIDELIAESFPPSLVTIRRVTPTRTQKGTLNLKDFRWAQNREFTYDAVNNRVVLGDYVTSGDVPDLSWCRGDPFDLCEYVEFNTGSPKQMVERLNAAGWKPTEKTKGHIEALRARGKARDPEKLKHYEVYGWKVNEENLRTLPSTAPAGAFALAQRLVLSSRISDLEEWLELERKGKLHGTFTSIGAWTHRVSHSKPNTANIPKAKPSDNDTEFDVFINGINDRMRELFSSLPGWRLIGTDADGIQMRIFAHLTQDEALINALVNGRKEDGTDIHSLHKRYLGEVCHSRDEAKTFIYAFLLGAGIGKVAEILSCTFEQAKDAVAQFIEQYPGLKRLKETLIPEWAERGYFIGLDGRKVACRSEHLMLSGLLQNGEKIIMARAMRQWTRQLTEEKIPYVLHLWVHDEWQTGCPDDDDVCKYIQQVQVQSIRDQGPELQMVCPLEGSTDWGWNWQETH